DLFDQHMAVLRQSPAVRVTPVTAVRRISLSARKWGTVGKPSSQEPAKTGYPRVTVQSIADSAVPGVLDQVMVTGDLFVQPVEQPVVDRSTAEGVVGEMDGSDLPNPHP